MYILTKQTLACYAPRTVIRVAYCSSGVKQHIGFPALAEQMVCQHLAHGQVISYIPLHMHFILCAFIFGIDNKRFAWLARRLVYLLHNILGARSN